jgi:DNA polymerase phi
MLHGAEVTWKADAIEVTVQQILVEYKSWTPEKIAVALKLQSLYPEQDWTKIFAPTFKNGDLLASANLQTLARIVKVGSAFRTAVFISLPGLIGIVSRG